MIQSCAARALMLGSRNKLSTPVLCAIDRVMLWFPTMAKKGVLSQYLAELGCKGGKVTTSGRVVVSADGKSRTVTTSGTDPQGKKFKSTAVYEKQ